LPELAPVEHYEKVNSVVDLFVKGYKPTVIAKRLGYTRKDVLEMIEDWKGVVSRDPYIKARALDTVNGAIEHYDDIKARAWDLADRAKNDDDRKSEIAGLTLASNIEQKRFELLKAAGVMQDEDVLNKVVEIEEQKNAVINLLRTLAPKLCDKDRRLVAEELAKLSDKAEVIPIGD
jgi:hypothetical protein